MIELALLTLVLGAPIGPTNLVAVKEGIKKGASVTFWVVFGAVFVDLLYANLAGIGLAAIGHNYYFKLAMLFLGFVIFMILGVRDVKLSLSKNKLKEVKVKKNINPFLLGVVLTMPNPFLIIFWTTAIAGLDLGYRPVIYAVIILGVGGALALVQAIVVHYSKKHVKEKVLRVIEFISGIVIIGFGVKFFVDLVYLLSS